MVQLDTNSFSGNSTQFNGADKVDFVISISSAIPFSGIFIALIIVVCRRKIEDFYLRWSLWVLFAAMGLRIVMSSILIYIYAHTNLEHESAENLANAKFEVCNFTLPYYFFLMVMVSLLFSAHTFYIKLRDLLYPQLLNVESRMKYLQPSKVRYFVLQGIISTILLIFVLIISLKEGAEDADQLFKEG